MTSDTNDYPAWSPNTSFIKANILIDSNGCARLADFGLLTLVSDSTNSTTTNSSSSGGSTRWMSPELIDPKQFGLKDNRRTKESDYYAFAMVVLEVLTGQVPFPQYEGFVVPGKVVKGERPERPQGPEAAWFTDDLWEMLERCWSPDLKLRPAVEVVLEHLECSSMAWRPLPPSADDGFQLDDDHDSFSTMSHLSCASLNLYLSLHLSTELPANRTSPRVEFDLAAGVSGDNAAGGGGTSISDGCDVEVDVDDELLRPVDGDMRSRPGQETDTAISSRIYSKDLVAPSPNLPQAPSYNGSFQNFFYTELEFDGNVVVLDEQGDYDPAENEALANNPTFFLGSMDPHVSLSAPTMMGGDFGHFFDHGSPACFNPGSPSRKPPSPPSLIIPVNAENSSVRAPLTGAPQGDGGILNGPQRHFFPATSVSGGESSSPFISNPTEGTFCSL